MPMDMKKMGPGTKMMMGMGETASGAPKVMSVAKGISTHRTEPRKAGSAGDMNKCKMPKRLPRII